MKFICKELSSKSRFNIFRTLLLSLVLTSICTLFLPTVSVEGKTSDLNNKITYETIIDNDRMNSLVNVSKVNPTLNKTVNMKQMTGIGQTEQWLDSVLDRVNTVVERCKGKFSSLDMILIPLNLNSNHWINH